MQSYANPTAARDYFVATVQCLATAHPFPLTHSARDLRLTALWHSLDTTKPFPRRSGHGLHPSSRRTMGNLLGEPILCKLACRSGQSCGNRRLLPCPKPYEPSFAGHGHRRAGLSPASMPSIRIRNCLWATSRIVIESPSAILMALPKMVAACAVQANNASQIAKRVDVRPRLLFILHFSAAC